MSKTWVKVVLFLSGIYDAALGLAFSLGGPALLRELHIVPPNHGGYIRFPGLVLLIFAAMFLRAAGDPLRRSDVLLYGAALKVSYFSLVFWYQFRGSLPGRMWIPLAWTDVAFFVLMVMGWRAVTKNVAPLRQAVLR
jgi:hypothetical protein